MFSDFLCARCVLSRVCASLNWSLSIVRHKLKQHGIGINHYWTEIKRILRTQKAITTEADNALGEPVQLRLCSDPTDSAAELYRALGYNPVPSRSSGTPSCRPHRRQKKKSVVPTANLKKTNPL